MLRLMLAIIAFALPSLAAADGDNPIVAILRYGGTNAELTWSEFGVMEMLQATGYISADDREGLDLRQDFEGDNITIIFGDAAWDLALANLMIDDALGRDADVLVTLTTPVTRAAINATADMDDAPPVLFASVFSPDDAGIIKTACDKPANATGSQIEPPYARSIALLQEHDPDLASIGIIHTVSEITGVVGAEYLTAMAEEAGIAVEQAAVNNLADFPAATGSLQDKGVEAIIAPIDAVTAQALPVISQVANESGIPVLYPILGSVYHGTTFGVGFTSHYQQGINLGRLVTAYLAGDLDTASAAVHVYQGESHSVSLDAAAEQDIDIAQSIIDSADIVIQDGEATQSEAFVAAYAVTSMEELQSDEARAADAAFIADLQCEG